MAAAQALLAMWIGLEGRNSRNSLLNSLLAGNFVGDRRDHYCIASQAVRSLCRYPEECQKGPPTAGFWIWPPVSRLPFRLFGGPNRRKSPALFENIPVFRRLRPETWFERHCQASHSLPTPSAIHPSVRSRSGPEHCPQDAKEEQRCDWPIKPDSVQTGENID